MSCSHNQNPDMIRIMPKCKRACPKGLNDSFYCRTSAQRDIAQSQLGYDADQVQIWAFMVLNGLFAV